jgi:hypothetical protein
MQEAQYRYARIRSESSVDCDSINFGDIRLTIVQADHRYPMPSLGHATRQEELLKFRAPHNSNIASPRQQWIRVWRNETDVNLCIDN